MKKVLSLVLAAVMLLALCACGSGSSEPTENLPVQPQGTVSVETIAPPMDSVVTEPVETTPVVEAVEVPLGSVMSTEFVEMTFSEVIIDADIKHSVTIGNVTRTTGPDPVAGQKYICLTGTIKNTSTSPLPVYDFFVGNFNLDGYNYTVDANDCDILNGEGSTEYEISPLMEYTFRIYVAIPDSLADSHSTCNFRFGFYDLFDNKDLAYNKAFAEDPIATCPYQFIVPIK